MVKAMEHVFFLKCKMHEIRLWIIEGKGSTYQEKEMNSHYIWKQYYKKITAQPWDADNFGNRTKSTSAVVTKVSLMKGNTKFIIN